MKRYLVYAKPLQNNPANETIYVQVVVASSKKEAVFLAMTSPVNRGIYALDSFFAVISPEQGGAK